MAEYGPEYGPEYAKLRTMRRISIQDLKAQLSAAIAEAESGKTIVITRHNEPVAELTPAQVRHLHRGRLFGKARIVPAVKKGTNGRYLKILFEDRSDR
jgi:prevent-host-death family protein